MVTGMILLRKRGSSKDSLPTPTSSPSQIPSLASGARPQCLAMQYVRMMAPVTTLRLSSMMVKQTAGLPLATCRNPGVSMMSLKSPLSFAQGPFLAAQAQLSVLQLPQLLHLCHPLEQLHFCIGVLFRFSSLFENFHSKGHIFFFLSGYNYGNLKHSSYKQ